MPAQKAPSPDGFTAEFIKACWPTVRQDFTDVFQQLYHMRGRASPASTRHCLPCSPSAPTPPASGTTGP
uniref:Uncharacterized protein n=1 Tax=Aegilops tauschii subsp. strangulata TaxID=200361 RepID=A0A453MY33_AEGTS